MTKFKEVLGNCKVFYRIYPSEQPDWDNLRFLEDEKTIQIHNAARGMQNNSGEKVFKQFKTDGFFYNIPQNDIFSVVTEGVIESVFQGQNAIIVAFGQTGSGKSLTIGGLHSFYQDRGLIPRMVENIFILKNSLPDNLELVVHMSYLEILSSFQAHDLLRPYPSPVDKNGLHKQIRKLEVRSDLQTLQHLFIAEGRKEYTPDKNYPSHVGSSILTFEFTIRDLNFSVPYEFISKLHIIDLAGNDKFGDQSSIYKKYWQVGIANSTKSFLEHFMLLICGNDPELARVKKRTNIISQYLGDTFNRGSLIRLIGHLKTSKHDHSISMSLLKFGQLFKTMESQTFTVVLKENELMKIAVLEEKLNHLIKEKLMKQMLEDQEPKTVCPESVEHMRRVVEDFVHNKIDGTNLLKMGDIFTILKIMKKNIITLEENEKSRALILESIEAARKTLDESQKEQTEAEPKIDPSSPEPSEVLSTAPQLMNGKGPTKGGHIKKTSTILKTRHDSTDTEFKLSGKKGKLSAVSLNGLKRLSTVNKKKNLGATESQGSADKSARKAADNQQNSSLLSAANLILPDVIPEHKEALKEYVLCPKTSYKTSLETFKKYENDAKEIYLNYLKELKKLDMLFEILDLRKNEVIQTKLVTQFSRNQERTSVSDVKEPELEERCRENLKKAERDVTNQQEVILSIQADFKIALSIRQQIKNDIKEEFEEFCKEKYATPVQNLEDVTEFALENEIDLNEFCEQVENEKALEIPKEQVFEEIYKNLKKLMIVEAKKKSLYSKKSIKWLQNTHCTGKL